MRREGGEIVRWLWLFSILISFADAQAQACFKTSVMAPSPLMGNHGEIFRTAEGAIYEVVGSYEYLYAYYPEVTICPARGRMLVEGKTLGIQAVQPAARRAPVPTNKKKGEEKLERPLATVAPITVVVRVRSCDYFIADGPQGHYLLEWYGGHDPDRGDGIYGQLGTYGFKDVFYDGGQEGRLYIDDYLLSKDSALEKLGEKCR
jgi:hypothetical protein